MAVRGPTKLGRKVSEKSRPASRTAAVKSQSASKKAGARYGSASRGAGPDAQARMTPHFATPKMLGKPNTSIAEAYACRENPFAKNSFDVAVVSLRKARLKGFIRGLDHCIAFKARTRTNENGHYHNLVLMIEPHKDGSVTKHSKLVYTCDDASHTFYGIEWHNSRKDVGLSPLYYSNGQKPVTRRPGKGRPTLCIAKGTRVATDKGLRRIETISPGDLVATPSGYREVLAAEATGVKPTVVLHHSGRICEGDDGPRLRLTADHMVLVHNQYDGISWKRADNVTQGDFLVRIHQATRNPCLKLPKLGEAYHVLCASADKSRNDITPRRMPTHLTPELAELVGFWVSGGSGHSISQTRGARTQRRISYLISELFDPEGGVSVRKASVFLGKKIGAALEAWGLIDTTRRCHNQRTPDRIMRSNDEVVAAYLGGLLSGDGWTNGRTNITFASKSPRLAAEFVLLAARLGFPFSATEGYTGHAKTRMVYVRMTQSSLVAKALKVLPAFKTYSTRNSGPLARAQPSYATQSVKLDLLNMLGADKVFVTWLSGRHSVKESRRSVIEAANKALPELNASKSTSDGGLWFTIRDLINAWKKLPDCPTRDRLALYRVLAGNNFSMTPYSRTTKANPIMTYDLTVAIDECFVANGVVVHNCKHATAVLRYVIGKKLVPVLDAKASSLKKNDQAKLQHPYTPRKQDRR